MVGGVQLTPLSAEQERFTTVLPLVIVAQVVAAVALIAVNPRHATYTWSLGADPGRTPRICVRTESAAICSWSGAHKSGGGWVPGTVDAQNTTWPAKA